MESKVRLSQDGQDYRDAIQHIYGLAHNVCINGVEQRELVTALQKLEVECFSGGSSGEMTIARMLGIILDGVGLGNWPWVFTNKIDMLKE